ncbi:MAG: hypothetical protein ACLRK1_03495 [Roseburia faecis]
MDKLYSFIMRGELTKVALEKTDVISRHSHSDIIEQEYIKSLSLDLLDEEYVNTAKEMATVYAAIAAFENTVREFVVKILIENVEKTGGSSAYLVQLGKKPNLGRKRKIKLNGIHSVEIR